MNEVDLSLISVRKELRFLCFTMRKPNWRFRTFNFDSGSGRVALVSKNFRTLETASTCSFPTKELAILATFSYQL
jgi:hypothetical protein